MALRRSAHKKEAPPSARQAQKAATASRILQIARDHFERDGFAAANLRAIAAEAEVAPGTILLHFTDKAGLLHAALHSDLDSAIDRSLRAPRGRSLLQRLCSVVRPFFDYYAARAGLSKTLLRESLLAESPWRERFSEQVLRVQSRVAALIEQAKAQGELSPAASTPLLSTAFLSFYYLSLIGWVQEAVADPQTLFKGLMAQHLRGCSPDLPRTAAATRRRSATSMQKRSRSG